MSTRHSLARFQHTIAATLMRPLTREDGMSPDSTAVAEKMIKPNDRLTSFERLQIYNQQYWWRLLGAFQEDFRGLRAVLGERKFDHLAAAYLASHPSTSWTLRNIGRELVAFLEAHPELTKPRSALALDVARVEWARVMAFDEMENAVIDPQRLAKIAPEKIRLNLQPYVSLLELSHPIDELMKRLKQSASGSGAASNAVLAKRSITRATITVRRSRKPIHLAVHRVNFSVYYKRLDLEAFRLLCALRDGATLEAACDLAFAGSKELPAQSAAKIQEWFARWMEFGWLCRRK